MILGFKRLFYIDGNYVSNAVGSALQQGISMKQDRMSIKTGIEHLFKLDLKTDKDV